MTEVQNKFLSFCSKEQPIPFIPTEAQQKAIFDDINIVAAGAGSGKTAVLSHRFLYLVMTGLHADEILTMTFTKDATANMKKKIYTLLKKASDEQLIDKVELDKFSSSTISTTDGFCSEIAKSASSDFGISSSFQIENEEDLLAVSDKISDDLLKKYQDNDMLHILLDAWSVDSLKLFLFTLAKENLAISRPIDFSKYKGFVVEKYSQYTELGLDNLIDDFLDYVDHRPELSDTLLKNKAICTAYKEDKNIDNLFGLLSISSKASNDIKATINAIKDYVSCFLVVHPQCLKLLDFMTVLCTEYQAEIFKHKRETGSVTYRDVLLMALDILDTKSEIRNYYQNKFKAIMVDEFQDNNGDNKKLVYQIAGSNLNSVFMVGDEKQSIYRFRNADVSVFKNMTEDFGNDKVVQLQQNYRSESKLIEIINQIFEKVFEGATEDYEASYTPLISSNNKVKSKVVFYYNNDEESKQTKTSEADNIACVIEDILGSKKSEYQIPSKEGLRDPKPSDIAILLKVGTHQIYYEKALRRHSIAFESVENKSLTLDAVASDFYNLLQLAVWGYKDEVAWYGLKNSPLGCNKSDDELKALITDIHDKLAISTIAVVFSYIWNNLGYRFFILRNKKNHQYEEHYDYLFALATKFDQNQKTVVELLDYIRPMLGEDCCIKDVQIQREVESGVKIMSIHKSKGLEFPIVIVPDMQSGSRTPGGFKPNIRTDGGILSFPYAYKKGSTGFTIFNPLIDKDDDVKKEFAETKRVLYVAATRAQYHLIMSGIVKNEGSMMDCLVKALNFGEDQNPNIEYIPYNNKEVVDDNEQVNYTKPLDSWYENTFDFKYKKLTTAITSLDIDKPTKFDNPLPTLKSDEVVESWAEFGTYVHAIMERTLCNLDTQNYYGSYENNANRDIIKADALTMRDNFVNSAFFKSLESFEKFTEKSFFYYDAQSHDVMEGIVDLLCVGKDKVVIVDYKTDKFKDPSTHKDQLETYVRAMQEKYNRPVEAYLFYLRSGAEERMFS